MREICTANIPSRHFKTLSSNQNPGWLGYVGDYTTQLYKYSTQLYRYYNKKNDLRVSRKTKQLSMACHVTGSYPGSTVPETSAPRYPSSSTRIWDGSSWAWLCKPANQKRTAWNAKCPVFLGNFTPKTSNYCLKSRVLGFPGGLNQIRKPSWLVNRKTLFHALMKIIIPI